MTWWWGGVVLGFVLPLSAQDQAASAGPPAEKQQSAAPAPRSDDFDWLQFNNGEWLKGEIKDLQDKKFTFESDQLDTLHLDWEDIKALYSKKQNTLLFKNKTSAEGKFRIEGDEVVVTTSAGDQFYHRDQLRSITPGRQTEWNYWSGNLTLGATFRRGNVNQSDISAFFRLQRRSPGARSRLDYNGVYGDVDGQKTAANQRALLTHDVYLTPHLYLRPVSFEFYRDEFQNIGYRITPAAGLGYDIIDRGGLEWSVSAGAGYQYAHYWEVAPGEASSDGTAALIAGTDLEWEATSWMDVGFLYNITLPVPETQRYNFHAEAYVSFDLWNDLDLDVRLTWDRVNDPVPNPDGTTPKPQDVRLLLGLGWEF